MSSSDATEDSAPAAAIDLLAAFADEEGGEDDEAPSTRSFSVSLPDFAAMDGWTLGFAVGGAALTAVVLSMAGIVAYRCTLGKEGRFRGGAPTSSTVELHVAVQVVKTIRKRMAEAKISLQAAKKQMVAQIRMAAAAGQPLQGLPPGMAPQQALQIMLQQQAQGLMGQAETGAFAEHGITGEQFNVAVETFKSDARFKKEAVKLKTFMDNFTKPTIPKELDNKESAHALFDELMNGYCNAFGQAFAEVKAELHSDDEDAVMRADTAAMQRVKLRGNELTLEEHEKVIKGHGFEREIIDTVLNKYLTTEEIEAKKKVYAAQWKEKWGACKRVAVCVVCACYAFSNNVRLHPCECVC